MTDKTTDNNKATNLNAILEKCAAQTQSSRQAKRLAQHQHWMRVMMEGQATPDIKAQYDAKS